MKFTVHGGHAAQGNAYSGASGYCQESIEDRLIKDAVIKYLKQAGHESYDCTVDTGTSQSGIITSIKSKINSYSGVTANLSIHLNAYEQSAADGKTRGTECCVYSNSGASGEMAARICSKISALGFTNRGVKERTNLGVLKGITNSGANILVEAFFCDDEDDFNLYQKTGGADAIGKAIAEGVLNTSISTDQKSGDSNATNNLETNNTSKDFEGRTTTMQCFYTVDNKGAVIYFDGQNLHPLSHPDEMTVLNKIYKDNNGKDMPCYSWSSSAPWHIRLKQAIERTQ